MLIFESVEVMSAERENAVAPDMIEVRDQDRHLPIANIARIMKRTLPENSKVSKVSFLRFFKI